MHAKPLMAAIVLTLGLGACKHRPVADPIDPVSAMPNEASKQVLIDHCMSDGENQTGCVCLAEAAELAPADLYAQKVAQAKIGEDANVTIGPEENNPFLEASFMCMPNMNISLAIEACVESGEPADKCACQVFAFEDALDGPTFGSFAAGLGTDADLGETIASWPEDQQAAWAVAAAEAGICVSSSDTGDTSGDDFDDMGDFETTVMVDSEIHDKLVESCLEDQVDNRETCECYTVAEETYNTQTAFDAFATLTLLSTEDEAWSGAYDALDAAEADVPMSLRGAKLSAIDACFAAIDHNEASDE